MVRDTRQVGKAGEEAATRYLISEGYELIERNYRTRFGEIDVICMDGNVMVFVEVKAKRGYDFGIPEEMFTRHKYEKVKRMAQVYLRGKEKACRIDMVAVDLGENDEVKEIRHYRNVNL